MTEFRATFETVIAQSVTVDLDVEPGDDGFENALEEAWQKLDSVPFIGWHFDTFGDWEPRYVVNEVTGEEFEVKNW